MLLSLLTALSLLPQGASTRVDRLVALARLDAAVHYFNPGVATRASSWDSLFAAYAIRIADAPSPSEYGRLVASLMSDLHDAPPVSAPLQRALRSQRSSRTPVMTARPKKTILSKTLYGP